MNNLGVIKQSDIFPELPDMEVEKGQRGGTRKAARAVLFDSDGNVGLLHVANKHYYKLPGGGIDGNEEVIEALKRECREEIGCEIEVFGEVGEITEHRNKIDLVQTSYCYLANVVGPKGEPHLEEDEREAGFTEMWVGIDEAIELVRNSEPTTYDGAFIIVRDLKFLKKAKALGKEL
ncbi:MAG: NUDIX domain-containing protein [Patescibacteria group bacterium]